MTNTKELERLVEAYNEYCAGEFGNDSITVEEALRENELGILYTTAEEDEEYGIESDCIEFQASYFLDTLTLEYFIDGHQTMVEHFESMADMLKDIQSISWDEIYHTLNSMLYGMLEEGTARIEDNELVYE